MADKRNTNPTSTIQNSSINIQHTSHTRCNTNTSLRPPPALTPPPHPVPPSPPSVCSPTAPYQYSAAQQWRWCPPDGCQCPPHPATCSRCSPRCVSREAVAAPSCSAPHRVCDHHPHGNIAHFRSPRDPWCHCIHSSSHREDSSTSAMCKRTISHGENGAKSYDTLIYGDTGIYKTIHENP